MGLTMIQEDELLMMVLGLGTLVLIWTNYSKIRRFESVHLFLCAFFCMLAGWCLTIIESIFLYSFFNFFEHICYLAGSIFLTCWIWRIQKHEGYSR